MTSESDSTSGRRPPTIELTATEVEQPKASRDTAPPSAAAENSARVDAPRPQAAAENPAPQTEPDPKPAAKSESRLLAHAVSAVIGAVAAAAVLVGLWLSGFILARDVVTQSTAPAPGTAASSLNADISVRLDKIEHAIQSPVQAPRPETATIPAALGNRLAAAESQTKALGDSLAVLNRRLDDVAATAQIAQKQATGASTAADAAKDAGQASVQHSDMDALAGRIAALESAVKTLSEDVAHPAPANDQAARLTAAAQALRPAVERGSP
jgi:hypothetical protein